MIFQASQPNEWQIGCFFDGTGNNYDVDKLSPDDAFEPTNIAKLYELYASDKNKRIAKYYFNGIGTGGVNLTKQESNIEYSGIEMAFGIGIGDRVKQAFQRIKETIESDGNITQLTLDVFGFSRGAATARIFVNELFKSHILDNNPLSSVNVTIRFLGIFDTVGSIGVSDSGRNAGYDLNVYENRVQKVVHLTAHHEYRKYFPLSSIQSKSGHLPEHFEEIELLGAHSDVGGGYNTLPTKIYLDKKFLLLDGGDNKQKLQADLERKIAKQKKRWDEEWADYLSDKRLGSDEITIEQSAIRVNHRGETINSHKLFIYYCWNRKVDKSLSNCALQLMAKKANEKQVPLADFHALNDVRPPLSYEIPIAVKDYHQAISNKDTHLCDHFGHYYPKYIHHSHQFQIPKEDALVNPNSVDIKGNACDCTLTRQVFYNRPS